jgi:hypothetical protein
MPYRRLPNTDQARLRALKTALDKKQSSSPNEQNYSNEIFHKIRTFLPKFELAIESQKEAFKKQAKSSSKHKNAFKKAKLYISHFIQVMNFAVLRNEFKPAIRNFYALDENDNKVPTLNTETEIVEWGNKMIKGEEERTLKGGNPILNPKIALVKVNYEIFIDSLHFQKTLQAISNRASNNVAKLRDEADAIILSIWNEVEENFNKYSASEKRKKCNEFGVVYVFRKNEKNITIETISNNA